jgi:hypothetical protein
MGLVSAIAILILRRKDSAKLKTLSLGMKANGVGK